MKNILNCSTLRAVLAVFLGLWITGPGAAAREWTSTDGRKLQAFFVSYDGEKITLKLKNGQTVAVPKDKLIKGDVQAAELLNRIGDDTFTKYSAKKIDSLLAGALKEKGFKSFNEALPDDLFVRRVYLDIIGRIPTREEFREFADSARPDKREALIDELLLRPGYAQNLFNYFADMFRLNARDFDQGVRMEPYIQWWKESLESNKPYDEMVREMITAKGNIGQNPAAGFLLRDAGMEFDAFSNFGQVMLGIDISCAQCHDHPFEDWTMEDFYKMAAFFGQTQRTVSRYNNGGMSMAMAGMPGAPEGWQESFREFATQKGVPMPKADPAGARQFGYYVRFLGWNLTDVEDRESPVPDDVGEVGGEIFSPGVLLGNKPKMGNRSRREALADWLTDKENPRFALVIANRMWSRAFGRPLIGPVHDFADPSKASQPETLEFVTSEMRRVGYDLREFMRILYNTRAYQSLATMEEPDWADDYYFQGPVLRRMRAEQAWDSLMVLAHGNEIDTKKGRDGSFIKTLLNVDFEKDSMESIFAKYEAFQSIRGGRAGEAIVTEAGSLTPAFVQDSDLRASEMEQPAPPASLLDTFGQSDRLVTDKHNFDGSVPQVLALMNGPVTSRLTGSSSKVVDDLEQLDGPDDKVRGVFFTILSRFPTDEELALGMKMLADYGDDGIRDLAWALMNGPEFLFIQ